MAAAGESVRVVHVCGGHEVLHRLLDIGIVPGQLLRVIHNDPNGPLVVSVHNASMMINRGLAARIRIAEE
jgi:Fe2+ transport system protein FeoA